MSSHSIAEASSHLAELVDRALAGEDVLIDRDGHPVVEIKPVAADASAAAKRMSLPVLTNEVLDWLAASRAGTRINEKDAATLVREMRDEGY